MPLLDRFGRPLRSLRLSVTDRCNLRCQYCMPEPDYVWLPRESLLTFEEIGALVDTFTPVGVDRVRHHGRRAAAPPRPARSLVAQLAARPAIADLALTTNGVLLAGAGRRAARGRAPSPHRQPRHAAAGTVPRADARSTSCTAVLAGIDAARARRASPLKLDTVVMRGVNDDELMPLLEFARRDRRRGALHRVHGRRRRHPLDAVGGRRPRREMLARIAAHYGAASAGRTSGSSAPADRFRLPDGTTFGIISSTTEPFCATCDRSRLTADGVWLLCLYATTGTDLRRPLRAGATPRRARTADRGRLVRARGSRRRRAPRHGPRDDAHPDSHAQKKDAHLEMHTRGG